MQGKQEYTKAKAQQQVSWSPSWRPCSKNGRSSYRTCRFGWSIRTVSWGISLSTTNKLHSSKGGSRSGRRTGDGLWTLATRRDQSKRWYDWFRCSRILRDVRGTSSSGMSQGCRADPFLFFRFDCRWRIRQDAERFCKVLLDESVPEDGELMGEETLSTLCLLR